MLRDATDKRGFESSTVGQHVIAGVTHRLVRVFHTGNRQLTSSLSEDYFCETNYVIR